MRYEARLLGGPADTEIFVMPDLRPEILVARPGLTVREPWKWDPDGPLRPIPVERHSYRPVRAVVFYEHAGVTT